MHGLHQLILYAEQAMAGTLMCPAVTPLGFIESPVLCRLPWWCRHRRGCCLSLIEFFAPLSATMLRSAGYLSWRSHVWTDVDDARCGTLPFVFDPDFGFERYVDYALQVPMYFVYR